MYATIEVASRRGRNLTQTTLPVSLSLHLLSISISKSSNLSISLSPYLSILSPAIVFSVSSSEKLS